MPNGTKVRLGLCRRFGCRKVISTEGNSTLTPVSPVSPVSPSFPDRLAALLRQIIGDLNQPNDRRIYLIETQQALIPAQPGTTGPSNDWENEIHPTPGGYRKLAALWRPVIEAQV
jgi:lysophospholipase L1-like esterase